MNFIIKETTDDKIEIYKSNKWSSAEKPELLYKTLLNSHSFVRAWHNYKLVELGNAISDGHLVVYYPHLIVHPDFQGKGIGELILKKFQDGKADEFQFYGAGVPGNKIYDLFLLFQKDILDKQPDIVVFYIGINDVWHKA
ncbi:Histone acetyltransferase [Arcticibacter svalbardensis MN12-7]|uniref:Histone acetyltransferase n=1 Tax=Arcticibacter svalbardensis MN12-7 TaxID=1150600 RepID=R9GRY5_9SPHI|nr:GNAT family N-acetyltransferase [Arcticibacter svalbardensis]EOR94607.1 Histone acetyltransferase [Arcticibacter svalbardensis MN12-7]